MSVLSRLLLYALLPTFAKSGAGPAGGGGAARAAPAKAAPAKAAPAKRPEKPEGVVVGMAASSEARVREAPVMHFNGVCHQGDLTVRGR